MYYHHQYCTNTSITTLQQPSPHHHDSLSHLPLPSKHHTTTTTVLTTPLWAQSITIATTASVIVPSAATITQRSTGVGGPGDGVKGHHCCVAPPLTRHSSYANKPRRNLIVHLAVKSKERLFITLLLACANLNSLTYGSAVLCIDLRLHFPMLHVFLLSYSQNSERKLSWVSRESYFVEVPSGQCTKGGEVWRVGLHQGQTNHFQALQSIDTRTPFPAALSPLMPTYRLTA